MGLYGLAGEFIAHVLFPLQSSFTCANLKPLEATWCQTGFPAAMANPWIFYHVSVHFVLGLAVILMILPDKWKRVVRVVN